MTSSSTAWLASYPKSGNTWVRAQLSSLQHGEDFDLNRMDESSSNDRMDMSLGMPVGDLSDEDVAGALRLSWALRKPNEAKFIRRKTHRPWLNAQDGFPIPWQPHGACAIYVVRDPRGVVASWAHHLGISQESAAEHMSVARSDLHRSDNHGDESFTSWSRHVSSWLDNCGLPQMVVRYEDMAEDPERELIRMANFLQINASKAQIQAAVAACAFDELVVSEALNGFREAATPGRVFFRKGDPNSWKDEVPDHVLQKIVADHGEVMSRLGYL
ncbi:MAG: sulfotransferase domain-containing protein [Ilumatobacter sp.]|jgi:hypothetical protein|nr:sulfotransferase domain-containing protein [Ilumatobacter sp.]MDG1697180.1 sulfotransferase domain-containing protein [Ilumatobacter sp.]MDG2438722.1 sulfotransferase domain-containing protein [Ilumatobacter sp.]